MVRALRTVRPSVVFTHDPERPYPPYTTHRDHRIAGRATLDAVYPAARDRRAYPEHVAEGLQRHAVHQVWLFSSAAPDTWVDIAEGFERKVAARLVHASQTADPDALRHGWRERAAQIAPRPGHRSRRRSSGWTWTEPRAPLLRAQEGATLITMVRPPPPCSSFPSLVMWWLMWQWMSHLPGSRASQITSYRSPGPMLMVSF